MNRTTVDGFQYVDERFADIQVLRYRLNGFDNLTPRQKELVWHLSEATLWGRDITFDQFGKYNLRIRKTLEAIYLYYKGDRRAEPFKALETYLRQVWFSSGIYHHYGYEKFRPAFTESYFRQALADVPTSALPLAPHTTVEDLCSEICPVMFQPDVLPRRINKTTGDDLIATSACNFYDGLTQQEAEAFYEDMKNTWADKQHPISFGLNSKLIAENGHVSEVVWKEDGLYGNAISRITACLEKAADVAENDQQRQCIKTLIKYYRTGDLTIFNEYCIEWVHEHSSVVDFINGFIEVYGDPLGMKGTWEGIVEYKDPEATKRTELISDNAQWFEDHSPVDPRFKKKEVKGVSAKVICAAMLGGDEYPSTAIGINLPNADWIRAEHGSKSVTIGNITEAYKCAAKGNGFNDEFVIDQETLDCIDAYGDICDELHTDLHECLGHGSGQLLEGVSPDALKAYADIIEEARADLYGLYYIADRKLVDLGLVPDETAYKSQYYTYFMNGLMTQLTRIKPGHQIEEAHMRNRALICHWCMERGSKENVVEMPVVDGKTYVRINDYGRLRELIAELLAEVQRIKSEGDYQAAHDMVEQYGVSVDPSLHQEVLSRYEKLQLAPYKGFVNPILKPVVDEQGRIIDVKADYSEGYTEQMLRYSRDYSTLI